MSTSTVYINIALSEPGPQAILEKAPWKQADYMHHVRLMVVETDNSEEPMHYFFALKPPIATSGTTNYRLSKLNFSPAGLWLSPKQYFHLLEQEIQKPENVHYIHWFRDFKLVFLKYLVLLLSQKESESPDFTFSPFPDS